MSDAESPKPLPAADAVKSAIVATVGGIPAARTSSEIEYIRLGREESTRLENDYIRLSGLRSHYKHKSAWSSVLLATIVYMVIFESILIWFVGAGWWTFKDYAWLVPTLMIQFLAQIVGLGLLVVKSLFKDLN